jgi:arylsulfatase A-like enzyme
VLLLNTTPSAGAVRAGDWKLIVKQEEGARRQASGRRRGNQAVELYNLRDDPFEKTNIASEQPEKVKQLRQALAKFAAEAVPPKAGPEPKSFKAPAVWGETGG